MPSSVFYKAEYKIHGGGNITIGLIKKSYSIKDCEDAIIDSREKDMQIHSSIGYANHDMFSIEYVITMYPSRTQKIICSDLYERVTSE